MLSWLQWRRPYRVWQISVKFSPKTPGLCQLVTDVLTSPGLSCNSTWPCWTDHGSRRVCWHDWRTSPWRMVTIWSARLLRGTLHSFCPFYLQLNSCPTWKHLAPTGPWRYRVSNLLSPKDDYFLQKKGKIFYLRNKAWVSSVVKQKPCRYKCALQRDLLEK